MIQLDVIKEMEEKLVACRDDPKEDSTKQLQLALTILENEPGYYRSIILPMLSTGHEGELCNWLKDNGLMTNSLTCTQMTQNTNGDETVCNFPMKWTQARTVDKYQWKCLNCSCKRSIREHSFFKEFKCSLTNSIRTCLAWTRNIAHEDFAEILGLKPFVTKSIYRQCAQIASEYIRSHLEEWQLGGPNSLVVVDCFPIGTAARREGAQQDCRNNNAVPIICIAEVKEIPTRYWCQILPTVERQREIVNTISEMVLPGSVLVTELDSTFCEIENLHSLNLFPIIASVSSLKKFDRPGNTVIRNLETILEPAIKVCEAAQTYPRSEMQAFIDSQMWQQLYGRDSSKALECFFLQVSSKFSRATHA